jgi:UDP-GlcNAc3NAcA epimerase
VKVITIVGARPQFIKAAAVSRAFADHGGITEVIVHTGQHFDANMSDVFFEEMQIPKPDHRLEINSLSHGAMTGRMLERIEEIILAERPDCLMVYGDTNSTLAGALAARKLQVKVIHVEAGLRSFNMAMPEEVNRILTDRISDVLYCPTDAALSNLRKEGFDHYDCRIVKCGDVMEDAALFYAARAKDRSTILEDLKLGDERFLLCTLHRAENTDDAKRLGELVAGLNEVAAKHTVVMPLHPRTKGALARQGLKLDVKLIEPIGYFDMVTLLAGSSLVITDSGGLQKEAYFFDSHCLTMRDQTEWVELVENGFNVLVGADRAKLLTEVDRLLNQPFKRTVDLYGGGQAAAAIATDLAGMG